NSTPWCGRRCAVEAPARSTRAPGGQCGSSPMANPPPLPPTTPHVPSAPRPVVPKPGGPEAAGRFRLQGEIGHGGMGSVLLGRDPELNRELAVKVLLERHRDRPELVERFLEE